MVDFAAYGKGRQLYLMRPEIGLARGNIPLVRPGPGLTDREVGQDERFESNSASRS